MSKYGLEVRELRRWVVQPVLTRLGLYSLAAERLVLGTAMHESRLRFLDQVDQADKPGPAFGLWQMEGPTHADIYRNFLAYQPELKRKVLKFAGHFSSDIPEPGEMTGNLNYACAMCRVHYWRVRDPLPAADDVRGLAQYAKDHYNTRAGKATVEQYEEAITDAIAQEVRMP